LNLSTHGHKGSGSEPAESRALTTVYRTCVELAAEGAVVLLIAGIIVVLNLLVRLTIGSASSSWTWVPTEILDAVTLLAGGALGVGLVGRSLWKMYQELSRKDGLHKASTDDQG
jgi:hypothetical protein